MKYVLATYGVLDNSHRLLKCSEPQIILPHELEGLTDRPPGDISPGDIWWPSVGCGPVGEWWCIWWTTPESTATRAGMVRSEVALWPCEQIGFIEDLSQVFADLSGRELIKSAPQNHLEIVAEALLSTQGSPVIICNPLDIWPNIIVGLWRQLWPAARKDFSARIALIPPQSSDPTNFPWIIGTPSCRVQQWQQPFVKIDLSNLSGNAQINRAAKYLAGQQDPIISEIFKEIPPKDSNLTHLKQAARVADNIEMPNVAGDSRNAIAMLRTLITMAPTNTEGGNFKNVAISKLLKDLPVLSSDQVELLANIDLSAVPDSKALEDALLSRLVDIVPVLSTEKSIPFLTKLQPGKSQVWWQKNVKSVIQHGLDLLDKIWSRAAIRWLATTEIESVINGFVKNDKNIESSLIRAANKEQWSAVQLDQILKQAQSREWSILHAWCLVSSKLSVAEAFLKQKDCTGDPSPGFEYLIHNLPSDAVVKTIIKGDDLFLCKLVAQLTVQKPTLLCLIDVSRASNRLLWSTHIQLGGEAWPESLQPEIHGNKLLEAILSGEKSYNLIEAVGANLVQVAADNPRREKLWSNLSATELNHLLPLVANQLIGQINSGQSIIQPEPILLNKIIEILLYSKTSICAKLTLLSWNVPIRENEMIDWMDYFSSQDWQDYATRIGPAILRNKWVRAAKRLNEIRRSRPEAIPALELCKEILPMWDQWFLTFNTNYKTKSNLSNCKSALIESVADIGSELAPDRLDEIWERAGGKRKDLESRGTVFYRWQNAARVAANGGKCSLADLIKVLKEDFPYNPQLSEIEEVLSNLRI